MAVSSGEGVNLASVREFVELRLVGLQLQALYRHCRSCNLESLYRPFRPKHINTYNALKYSFSAKQYHSPIACRTQQAYCYGKSVRLSVTRWYILYAHNGQTLSTIWQGHDYYQAYRLFKIPRGRTPSAGALNTRGKKNLRLENRKFFLPRVPKSPFISETVQDPWDRPRELQKAYCGSLTALQEVIGSRSIRVSSSHMERELKSNFSAGSLLIRRTLLWFKLTQNDQIWIGNTSSGDVSNGSATPQTKGDRAPVSPKFCDLLHTRTQYEKQQ